MKNVVPCLILLLFVPCLALGQRSERSPVSLSGTGHLRAPQREYLQDLLRGFGNPDPDRRREAIVEVARIGDAAIPFVVEKFRSTSNALVLRCSLLTLAEIGGLTAANAVRKTFQSEILREEEQAVAALVLGKLSAGTTLDKLRKTAASRRPNLLRRAAAVALGRIADSRGIARLLASIDKEPLVDRRVAILIAAGETRDRELLPAVLRSLKDRTAGVRRAAVYAIGQIADPAALPDLIAALRREKDDSVRVVLALTLGRFEDPSSLSALQALARGKDPSVAAAALAALAARSDGVAYVRTVLESSRDGALLARTALACAASPGLELRPSLEELLSYGRPEVRSAAGLALAALDSRQSKQNILDWLSREKNTEARLDALLAAGALRFEDATQFLSTASVDAERVELTAQVQRTLQGRRDVRLLQDRLENRLRSLSARLEDRRYDMLQLLVDQALGTDDIDVRRATVQPPPDLGGGNGTSEPGGSEPGGGDEGSGATGFPRRKPSRIDRRNSSVERDLEAWFESEPYYARR